MPGLSGNHQNIIAGIFQLGSKMPAHVAVGVTAGGRGFGTEMSLAAGRQKMTGQGTSRCDQDIFGVIRFNIRRDLIIQQLRHKASAADVVFYQGFRQRLLPDGLCSQVDPQYSTSIAVHHGKSPSL